MFSFQNEAKTKEDQVKKVKCELISKEMGAESQNAQCTLWSLLELRGTPNPKTTRMHEV